MQKSEFRMQNQYPIRFRGRGAESTSAFCILRSAFSFTEVLFAVIILGIGFIMIAAIFPVAIQQTKNSTEETAGSTIARGAVNYIQSVVTDDDPRDGNPAVATSNIPETATGPGDLGDFEAIAPNSTNGGELLWPLVQGNVILPEDPRYGWVALYRRGQDSSGNSLPYAQVIVIPCEVRNAQTFVTGDTFYNTATTAVNLQARLLTNVDVADGGNPGIDTIDFGTPVPAEVASGAHVVFANGSGKGRIFRLGNATDTAGVFELMPGSDMEENDGTTTFTGNVYIVGRGWTNSGDPTLTGNAMDMGIYTTFVKVN